MVLTRSMVRVEARRMDSLLAPFKIRTLTTPGIVTEIALKLSPTDKGLVGFFMMVNDAHLREELQSFVDVIANHHKIIHNQLEQTKRTNEMVEILMHFLNRIERARLLKKSTIALEMFQYMCTLREDIFQLGKRFARILDSKITSIHEECLENNMHDMIIELDSFRSQLFSYIEWGKQEN